MKQPDRDKRSDAIVHLVICASEFPELRLCQIIGNALNTNDPYYKTDEELANALEWYRKLDDKPKYRLVNGKWQKQPCKCENP